MDICALASGSSGNCFYVAGSAGSVLIDAGISAKQILTRLEQVGGDPARIRAILLTHEHSDHIRGIDVLARKLNVPIFGTKATLTSRFICSNEKLFQMIKPDATLKLGGLTIHAFSKSHGAADPISFTIAEKKRIAIITDAGYACENVQKHVAGCDFLCIESNHDEHMLETGPYAYFLKKWISGDQGHLSNKQAAQCVKDHASERLRTIVLSHLSATNNTPEVALQTFKEVMKERTSFNPQIIVSVREKPTELFTI